MKTDRQELESLRLSVSRIGQVLGLRNELATTEDYIGNSRNIERGWNSLCGDIVKTLRMLGI